MREERWEPLVGLDKECFACGLDNPHGLQMTFESNGDRLRSTVTVKPQFRGWNNLVHGGILSTLLDEVMGWTALYLTKRFTLTKGMTVAFKKPVRIDTPIFVTGYVKERIGDRKVVMVGEIWDASGALCASSQGEFVLFTSEEFGTMGIMTKEELTQTARAISAIGK